MELAQDLFLTAVVAVLFSFVVAKLVSVALSGCDSVDSSKARRSGGDALFRGPFVEEVRFAEEELRTPLAGCETRVVEAVQEELRTVDRFGDEPLVAEEVFVVDPPACGDEVGLVSGMASDEPSEIMEKEASGEAEVLGGEAVECDMGEMEGNDGEASREANQSRDVEVQVPVVEAGEAADFVVEEEEKEEEVGDDDDWEGIERSELEKDFAAAARFADDRKDRLDAIMGDDTKIQLYGLHKVATEGPCHDSPPMAMKVAARAKWNAWQRLGNMNPDLAMEQYINLLTESIPNWSDEKSEEIGESDVRTLQQRDSPFVAVSDHQTESVVVREASVATEVNLDDPSHDASVAKE
ncbi:hypothetical protein MLD38_034863 [Melastoma candidum]|uniref:Uncharacterized protein n=1 Tax=Melastoma candidum TaxID=119954 RepID=A0ACB9MD40_9MYRT|nr:hypothetical protein MLD38_034863 [Melastoma candidum]